MSAENPPPWATAWGQDEYGIFAEFTVIADDGKEVDQRMRWIPPGKFMMGEEKSAHEVTLTESFWIFDTACTQALWTAVMGENPSRFVDPERPVEQVSWDDAQDFIAKLNEKAGLSLVLPTEAQWEYACRSGTETNTYIGDLEELSDCNSPELDRIAWYGGNSGHKFDLEGDAGDSPNNYSWITNTQYEFDRFGTRKVGRKEPNRWGLYDMLGNVWEWCQDWYGDYLAEPAIDPVGPGGGQYRVIRGGSLGLHRAVRAVRLPLPRPTRQPGRLHRLPVCPSSTSSRQAASVKSAGQGVRDGGAAGPSECSERPVNFAEWYPGFASNYSAVAANFAFRTSQASRCRHFGPQ